MQAHYSQGTVSVTVPVWPNIAVFGPINLRWYIKINSTAHLTIKEHHQQAYFETIILRNISKTEHNYFTLQIDWVVL